MIPPIGKLAIIGGGSWGTALGILLAPNCREICLWVHDPVLAARSAAERENQRHLPGLLFPDALHITHDFSHCLAHADIALIVIPSAFLRAAVTEMSGRIPDGAIVVSATKGLEPNTLMRMSEVIGSAVPAHSGRVLALSGPSFAREAARNLPTAVVVAGLDTSVRCVQACFARPSLRIYSSGDIVGVEMGGALKNVVAIGAGLAAGLGLGHNAIAALVTRGLAEITRLATRMGASARTMAGLAGLGDLILTCTGELSRNRQLGVQLATSHPNDVISTDFSGTTEGVRAAAVAVELGTRFNVQMPIAYEMREVLANRRSPAQAIQSLMERSLGEE